MKLKILSYNIHKGFNWSNQKFILQEIKHLIEVSGAELVFIQEVIGEHNKLKEQGHIDQQFEFLADNLWTYYSYARNAIYNHGHHGNLILSKYPIEEYTNIGLSTNILEQRGLLICKISLPDFGNKKLYAMCAHLDLFHRGRAKQYEKIKNEINNRIRGKNIPCILAGDFNDWNNRSPEIFEHELGMEEVHKVTHGNYAKTFPAFLPFLYLDRIYIKNAKALDAYTMENVSKRSLSDHLAIYSEIKIYEK